MSFECEAEEEIDDDNSSVDGGFSFTMVLDFIKSVFLTFFRLIGSLIGL